jgi:choline kinase
MKIIMLAAGRGTRISRHIEGKPKCCLDIGGTELINRNIKKLRILGFNEISIATGYRNDFVIETVSDSRVIFYNNPFFEVTNSIASLWFCQKNIKNSSDLYLMNGDVFFDEEIFLKLIKSDELVTMVADSSRKEEADYKFNWDQNYILKKFGKELPLSEVSGEYVGIAKINKAFLPTFTATMNNMILGGEYHSWWEDILYNLSSENRVDIKVIDIKGKHFWAEIDFVEDYNRIIEYLRANQEN